jgi:hypothetical protein
MDLVLADIARALGPLFGAAFGVLVMMLGAIPAALSWVLRGGLWIFEPLVLAVFSLLWAVLRLAASPFLIPWRVAIVAYEVWMDIYDEMKARTLLPPPPPTRQPYITTILTQSTQPLITFVSIPESHSTPQGNSPLHELWTLTPP